MLTCFMLTVMSRLFRAAICVRVPRGAVEGAFTTSGTRSVRISTMLLLTFGLDSSRSSASCEHG